MNKIISWVLAVFALAGGLDYLFGNKYKLGSRFEKALMLIGPMALSMIGVISMVPILAQLMKYTLVPLLSALHIDPGILGGIFPIDWGGFFLAQELAQNPLPGLYGGIVIAVTFGTAICFVIPLGVQVLKAEQQNAFARGILEGLVILPIALIVGGLCLGLSLGEVLFHGLPVLLLSLLLFIGILKFLSKMIKLFIGIAKVLKIIGGIGMVVGAFQHLTGIVFLPITPLADSLKIVSAIAITMMGALPFADVLSRLLNKPLTTLAAKLNLKPEAFTNLLTVLVSGTSGIVALSDLDERGIEFNAAAFVFFCSGLSAQLAFVLNNSPEQLTAYLLTKLPCGLIAGAFAIYMMKRRENEAEG